MVKKYNASTLNNFLTACINENKDYIEKLKNIKYMLNTLINSTGFTGRLGESVENYLREVELKNINLIISAAEEIKKQEENVKKSFFANIDNATNAEINTNALEDARRFYWQRCDEVTRISKRIDSIVSELNSECGKYGPFEKPSSEKLVDSIKEMAGNRGTISTDTVGTTAPAAYVVENLQSQIMGFEAKYKKAFTDGSAFNVYVQNAKRNMERLDTNPVMPNLSQYDILKTLMMNYKPGDAQKKLEIVGLEDIMTYLCNKTIDEMTEEDIELLLSLTEGIGDKASYDMTEEELVAYSTLLTILQGGPSEEKKELPEENIEKMLERLALNGKKTVKHIKDWNS